MDDEEDFSSDTSDEDYRPSDGEAVSEEDDSGEEENFEDGDKTDVSGVSKRKGKNKKKRKKETEPLIRKRQGGIRLEDEEDEEHEEEDTYSKQLQQQIEQEKEDKKQIEEKKKSDDLWASFLSDVGPRPKPKPSVTGSGLGTLSSKTNSSSCSASLSTPPSASSSTDSASISNGRMKEGKITITKEYDFAGETVKVTKEVEASSKEGKAELKKQEADQEKKSTISSVVPGVKRPSSGGGLGSVLGKIGKKAKISTLEKSKLDWNSFKRQEGIEDELAIHNRGKEGYMERQAFLNRTDQRQFEQERAMRLGSKK